MHDKDAENDRRTEGRGDGRCAVRPLGEVAAP